MKSKIKCFVAAVGLVAATESALAAPQPLPPIDANLPTSEASGMAASRNYPEIYWWQRDGASDSSKTEDDGIYALKMDSSGRLRNIVGSEKFTFFPVSGDKNTQWEDMVIDHEGHLWLGEIGANKCVEKQHIFKLREPDPTRPGRIAITESYSFQFPDPPEGCTTRNAEAMLWLDGNLYVIAKAKTHEGIYRVKFSSPAQGTATLTKVAEFNNVLKISVASVSSDKKRFVLAGFDKFQVFESDHPSLVGDAYLRDLASKAPKWSGAFAPGANGSARVEGGSFMPGTYDMVFVDERRQIYHVSATAYGGSPASPPSSPPPAGGPRPSPNPGNCEPNALLVNPCRPWLGAAANDYPIKSEGPERQMLAHEARIGRQMDIVHFYHPASDKHGPLGDSSTGSAEIDFAMRDGTYVFMNWKPADKWKDVDGGNVQVNRKIDQVADQLNAFAKRSSKKFFLTLNHEPENNVVDGGARGCRSENYAGGEAGTTAQYRKMWQTVRSRFDAKHVRNVVWVIDYMNYSKFDCMVDGLYPGNDHVDWIMFNGYGSDTKPSFHQNVNRFLGLIRDLSRHNPGMASKPLGIVEWGMGKTTDHSEVVNYLAQAKKALDEGDFPQLKAYMIFDGVGPDKVDYRVGYNPLKKDVKDEQRMQAYKAFANSAAFSSR